MSVDRFVDFLIEKVREEERRDKPRSLSSFSFDRSAKSLIKPAQERARHHRTREEYYTRELEYAEKNLREKGISMEVIDPNTGFGYGSGSVCSGAISVGNTTNYPTSLPKFQPKINQDMLGAVERAKTKMLEHRGRAEGYEKYARAFLCCPPDMKVLLTVEDIFFFRLEE